MTRLEKWWCRQRPGRLWILLPILCLHIGLPGQQMELLSDSAQYLEVDLRNMDTSAFPGWLNSISEEGGYLDIEEGWVVEAEKPFGTGMLTVSINPGEISGDLALTLFYSGSGTLLIQLNDHSGQLLLADVGSRQFSPAPELRALTVAIPLSQLPTAGEIVVRRLEGQTAVSYLSLMPFSAGRTEADAQIALAKKLGDPLAPGFPLRRTATMAWGNAGADVAFKFPHISAVPLIRPLSKLAGVGIETKLTEKELWALLRVLNMQGYGFNAPDFVRAAMESRREVVELYLRAGMPVDVTDFNSRTALIAAAEANALRVIEFLLDAGAEKEHLTPTGDTALGLAVSHGHFEACRLLVEGGANVNHQNGHGRTILHRIPRSETNVALPMLKYLLQSGADVDLPDSRGMTLIHWLGWLERSDLMRAALPYSQNIDAKDADEKTPLIRAKESGNHRTAQLLLAAGATPWEPTFRGIDEEFVYRMQAREWARAQALLNAGANPNQLRNCGCPVAFAAIRDPSLETLRRLVFHGVDLTVRNEYGHNILEHVHASYNPDSEKVIDYLLEIGIDPNFPDDYHLLDPKPKTSALMKAAAAGNATRCKRLIAAGANPGQRNASGQTAADLAERAGYSQLALELRQAVLQTGN